MTALLAHLSSATGLDEFDVRKIINRAPVSYKFYKIDKRTTGRRLISQPAREVKALQRAFVDFLRDIPVHDCAMAYIEGKSIRTNAEKHAGLGPIKKYDFKDFFHSIRAEDWKKFCKERNIFEDWSDVVLSSNLLFHKLPGSSILRLAMGAPSSPWLSNIIMYDFDQLLSDSLKKDRVTYTRYADDLTFSAPRTGYLNSVDAALKEAIRSTPYPSLTINPHKTVVATAKYRRVVTGLVLANDGRVTLGRERKRKLRAALHQASKGEKSSAENAQLAGMLAFAADIEPQFVAVLKSRYGKDLMERLLRSVDGQPI